MLKKRKRSDIADQDGDFKPPSHVKTPTSTEDGKKKRGRKPGTKNGEGIARKMAESLNPEEEPTKKKRGRKPGTLNQKTIL